VAINVYAGVMGSGKSYEVVVSVILPALLKGRDVVTNIKGMDYQKICDYLCSKFSADREKLGKLTIVTTDDFKKVDFFPDEEKPEIQSVVKFGDLVCVDECWLFWAQGCKISHNAMQFFRMHRHYNHSVTGVSCDIALMIQEMPALHRSIKGIVEMVFVMTKLKTVGLNDSYRVDIYPGSRVTNSNREDYRVKKYDPDIFPLYKSYAAGQGVEDQIDSRQNLLKNKRLWFIAVGMLAAVFVGQHYVRRFFSGDGFGKTSLDANGKPVASVGTSGSAQVVQPGVPGLSKTYRIAGRFVNAQGETWAVLSDSDGRLRVESPSVVFGHGLASAGVVEGDRVTTYTGSGKSLLSSAQAPISGGQK
jgi:zona occludens toxin